MRKHLQQPPHELKIIPAFAVPFGASYLNQANLNHDLKQLFFARENAKYTNKSRNSEQTDLVFESHFDLFMWPDEAVVKLKEFMTSCVLETLARVNRYTAVKLEEFDVYADAWFHITRKGGSFTNHNHPMASWSAVYCVDDGIDDADTANSGLTRFFHPNAAASTYLDAGNLNMTGAPFGLGHQIFKLKTGQIVIFPSWLYHDVSPYTGNSVRITVAVNYWFNHPNMDAQIGPKIYSGKK